MKVAIIVSDVNIFDGVNRVGADLITMLKSHGHEVAVCSWNQPADETFEEYKGVEHFYSASAINNAIKGRLIRSLFLSRSSIKKCLKAFDPDVFIGAGSEPAVWSSVPNDKIKIQYVHFPTEFFMDVSPSLTRLLYRSLYWHYHYQQLPRIDAVVCNSSYTKEITYLIWGKLVPEERISVIHPAIDLKRFQKTPTERKNQVCYIGRLSKGKGVEQVIEAFMQTYSEYKLKMVMAGGASKNPGLRQYWETKIRPHLEDLIKNGAPIELKIDPSYQEIVDILLESKAMLTYSQHEHFGIVAVEAQAAGCPPIVANSGGQTETVQQGENGFRANSPEELSKYLRMLLDDQQLWKRMSNNGRQNAKNFSLENIGNQWNDFLHLSA